MRGGGGPRSFGPRRAPEAGRRPAEDGQGAARGAKGVSRKKRLEEEKRRGGGNARRYLDDVDDE